MKRVLPILLLAGCFSEPDPIDDIEGEPVDESSSDAGSTASEATSDDDSIGVESSTGSLPSSIECPDDVLCIVPVVCDVPISYDVDEHEFPCPAEPRELAWLNGNDVILSVTIECGEPPPVVELDRMPTGWRLVAPECPEPVERLDAPRTCDGGACPIAGPSDGTTVLFSVPRAPC